MSTSTNEPPTHTSCEMADGGQMRAACDEGRRAGRTPNDDEFRTHRPTPPDHRGYASAAPQDTRKARQSLRRYTAAGTALAVFGLVYERLSFGVYSPFMMFAFVVPLLLGALPTLIAAVRGLWLPKASIRALYGAGVAMLAVGSVVRGVLDIYGTTNAKIIVYPVAGTVMLMSAIAWALVSHDKTTQDGLEHR